MGQGEVLSFLRKHPGKWFSVKQISARIGQNPSSLSGNARKLSRAGFIKMEMKEVNRTGALRYVAYYMSEVQHER